MEIFDIVDEQGNPTGQTVERTIAHRDGIMHRTAHIWIIKRDGNEVFVLLQKRSEEKDSFPGGLDTSSAGHIQAGDEVIDSAIRELGEELGIKAVPDDLKSVGTIRISLQENFHNSIFKDEEIAFVFIYDRPVDTDKLVLQPEEVSGVEWHSFFEAYNAQKSGDPRFCIPIAGLEAIGRYLGLLEV